MVFYIHKADNGIALISFQCQIQINTIIVAPKQFISTHTQYVEILEGKKREKKRSPANIYCTLSCRMLYSKSYFSCRNHVAPLLGMKRG